jgi:hypothetical protein
MTTQDRLRGAWISGAAFSLGILMLADGYIFSATPQFICALACGTIAWSDLKRNAAQ